MTLRKALTDYVVLVVGLGSAVLTARVLGDDGKGVLATLVFVQALVAQLATLGLGDALLVFSGRGSTRVADARRATMAAAVPTAVAGGLLYALVLALAFPDEQLAAALLAAGVPVTAVGTLVAAELYALGRLGAVVALTAAISPLSLGLTAVALLALDLGVAGAAGAQLVASATIGVVGLATARRERRRERPPEAAGPTRIRAYLRPALPFGLRTQAAALMAQASGRADLVVVAVVLGAGAAGSYSVALTVLVVAVTIPAAVSWVSFGPVAAAPAQEAGAALARATRISVALAAATTPVLVAGSVLGIPAVFGSEFSSAVVPAVVLVAGSAVNALQVVLSRGAAARGAPGVLLASWAVNAGVMLVLDAFLVPLLELPGAALASLAGTGAGAAVCWRWAARTLDLGAPHLLPGRAELREVVDRARVVVRPGLGAAR